MLESTFNNSGGVTINRPPPTTIIGDRATVPDPANVLTEWCFDLGGIGEFLSPIIGDERNRFPWIPDDGEPGEVDFLDNLVPVMGASGNYRQAYYIRCRLKKQADPEGGVLMVREVTLKKCPNTGQPIYAGAFVSLWKFLETRKPARSWMNGTEEALMRKAVAPQLEADKEAELADSRARQAQFEQLCQAHRARLNPQQFMADALAGGIAAALNSGNLKQLQAPE